MQKNGYWHAYLISIFENSIQNLNDTFHFAMQKEKCQEKVWKKKMGFGEEGKNLSLKGFSLFLNNSTSFIPSGNPGSIVFCRIFGSLLRAKRNRIALIMARSSLAHRSIYRFQSCGGWIHPELQRGYWLSRWSAF